jgi:hypothetical protein
MSERLPRYSVYDIDGHIIRDCCADTIEELNAKMNSNPKAYFVRDNELEKWL